MKRVSNSVAVLALAGALGALLSCPAAGADQPAPAAPKPPSVDPYAGETKAQHDARLKWLREARFGMFIHWGLYAVPAGTWKGQRIDGIGEWIMHNAKIPVADYAALASQFNPTRFNADEWAEIAHDAGMKYMVITSKHHDGFAMFHSLSDPYNIYDATPFKRDPIAELAAACKKRGIKFGVYYSQAQDWHHPGGAAYGGHWDKAQDGDLHEYVRKVAAPEVRELLTRYKPAVLWWDTPVDMSPDDIRALTAAFPEDPGLIANNRLGNGVPGDTETPEQYIPATGFPGRDWETCMTINDTWGYKSYDTNFKSGESLIRNLIDIASKGGNYLLNVGPDATGAIPAGEVERLKQMGAWLRANGDSIYGTTASPYRRLPGDQRATVKGNTLYLNVFHWPDAGLTLGGLQTSVRRARVVATGEKLTINKAADGTLSLSKPEKLDAVSTAIELRLSGPPVVTEPEQLLTAEPGGDFQLPAAKAELEGKTIQVEGAGGRQNIGFWLDAHDAAHWKISVAPGQAGDYRVTLNYSCAPGAEGSAFEIQVDGRAARATCIVTGTGGWANYQTLALPEAVHLSEGKHVLRIVPLTKPGFAVMNLRSIALARAI